MLTVLFRRLVVTGALVTAFVGTGLLFGQGPATGWAQAIPAQIHAHAQTDGHGAEPQAAASGLGASNGRAPRGSALGWPFFSFSRKGAR